MIEFWSVYIYAQPKKLTLIWALQVETHCRTLLSKLWVDGTHVVESTWLPQVDCFYLFGFYNLYNLISSINCGIQIHSSVYPYNGVTGATKCRVWIIDDRISTKLSLISCHDTLVLFPFESSLTWLGLASVDRPADLWPNHVTCSHIRLIHSATAGSFTSGGSKHLYDSVSWYFEWQYYIDMQAPSIFYYIIFMFCYYGRS